MRNSATNPEFGCWHSEMRELVVYTGGQPPRAPEHKRKDADKAAFLRERKKAQHARRLSFLGSTRTVSPYLAVLPKVGRCDGLQKHPVKKSLKYVKVL